MIRLCLWVRQLVLRVLGIASRQDIADMRRALAMLASELRRSTATKYKAQERGLALVQTQNKAQERRLALVLARLALVQTQNKAQERRLALVLARVQRQNKAQAQIQARLARIQIRTKRINDQLRHVEHNVNSLVRHEYVDQVALPFPHNVLSQRFHVWSQNEEDGITLALVKMVGSTTRRFVELGAGTNGGNTGFLAETCGWTGLMVDGSQANAEQLVARFSQFGVVVKGSWITTDNVNLLVRDSGMSGEIDLLSLDIDGNDYWIWQRLDACSPRIVVSRVQSRVRSCAGGHRAVRSGVLPTNLQGRAAAVLRGLPDRVRATRPREGIPAGVGRALARRERLLSAEQRWNGHPGGGASYDPSGSGHGRAATVRSDCHHGTDARRSGPPKRGKHGRA